MTSKAAYSAKVAANNTFQFPVRTLAAVAGIGFSILLVVLQLGFLNAARKTSTLLYEYFTFDIAVVSEDYQFLYSAPPFDRIRMTQARVTEGVGEMASLNIRTGSWVDPATELDSSMMLIGVDKNPGFINNNLLLANLDKLGGSQSIIIDRFSHKDYGDISVGQNGWVNGLNTEIVGEFELGMFFFAEGSVVTANGPFARLANRDSRMITVGMIKVEDGHDPNQVIQNLREALPSDVLVYDRDTFISQEQDYFIKVKPIGIMFQMGVLVSYAVGMVILYQVLSTEMSNRLTEFATMKAMGFGNSFIYSVGIIQTFIYALLSVLPAMGIAYGVFGLVYDLSRLPMEMTTELVLLVSGMTLVMCTISGYLALSKIRRADPADLF